MSSSIEGADGQSIKRGLFVNTTVSKGTTIAFFEGHHIDEVAYASIESEQGGYVLKGSMTKYFNCYLHANMVENETYLFPRYSFGVKKNYYLNYIIAH